MLARQERFKGILVINETEEDFFRQGIILELVFRKCDKICTWKGHALKWKIRKRK